MIIITETKKLSQKQQKNQERLNRLSDVLTRKVKDKAEYYAGNGLIRNKNNSSPDSIESKPFYEIDWKKVMQGGA